MYFKRVHHSWPIEKCESTCGRTDDLKVALGSACGGWDSGRLLRRRRTQRNLCVLRAKLHAMEEERPPRSLKSRE